MCTRASAKSAHSAIAVSPLRIKELWNAASKKHAETGDSSCRGHNSQRYFAVDFSSRPPYPSPTLPATPPPSSVLPAPAVALFSFSPFLYLSTPLRLSIFLVCGTSLPTTSSRRSRPQIDHGLRSSDKKESKRSGLLKNRECQTTLRCIR